MNRTYLRILGAVLIAAMTLSTFIACGTTPSQPTSAAPGESQAAPTTEKPPEKLEPITFTIWTSSADPGKLVEEDACHQFIREKLGVDIQKQYTDSDAESRLTLMLTSGDYPDALWLKPEQIMQDYVTGGHILEVGPWIEKYAPRLYDIMKLSPAAFSVSKEGFRNKFYWVPGGFGYTPEFPCIEPSLGFRYDIWKKLADNPADLPKPKDLDEFFDMAKKMQQIQPEYEGKKCYAFSGWFADAWGALWSVYAIQRFGGSHQWVGAATQADNWKRKYCFDSDVWMWAMRYLNRAYREGIGDPEAVTMNFDAYKQKLAQGIVYTSYYSGAWLDGEANTARAAAGHPEQKLVPYTWMNYPASSGITAKQISGQYMPLGLSALYITKNCKQAEEVFKRLSWLATEEGIVFQGMGVQGLHWDYDEEGFRKPTDEIIQMAIEDPEFIRKTGIGDYVFFSNYYGGYDAKGDAYVLTENKYYQAKKEDQYDLEYKQLLGLDLNLTVEANAARAGITRDDEAWAVDLMIEPGSNLASIESQLEAWEAEYIGKLYMAKDDATFNALVEEWKTKAQNIGYMDYYNHINPILEAGYLEYLSKKGK